MTYVPLSGKPMRLTLGLRALDPHTWVEVDDHRVEEMLRKRALLEEKHPDVVVHLPEGDAGSYELWDALSAHVLHHFPSLYREVEIEHGRIVALTDAQTGLRTDMRTLHPIDACGRLVQEDLALMHKVDDDWRLMAASVCFPSRWRLTEKLGQHLSGIHEPVPGYEEQIARPVEAMFDKITPEHPMWRLNWTVLDDPELHQPDADSRWHDDAKRIEWADSLLGEILHFRVERQTLVRLPESGDIVFTIRTYICSLDALAKERADVYRDLAIAMRSADPETVAYKGWSSLLEATVHWLDAQATSSD